MAQPRRVSRGHRCKGTRLHPLAVAWSLHWDFQVSLLTPGRSAWYPSCPSSAPLTQSVSKDWLFLPPNPPIQLLFPIFFTHLLCHLLHIPAWNGAETQHTHGGTRLYCCDELCFGFSAPVFWLQFVPPTESLLNPSACLAQLMTTDPLIHHFIEKAQVWSGLCKLSSFRHRSVIQW